MKALATRVIYFTIGILVMAVGYRFDGQIDRPLLIPAVLLGLNFVYLIMLEFTEETKRFIDKYIKGIK